MSSHKQIATTMDEYYDAMFGRGPDQVYTIDLDALSRDLGHPDMPFSTEEVEKVVKAKSQGKASGLDEFTGRFYATF